MALTPSAPETSIDNRDLSKALLALDHSLQGHTHWLGSLALFLGSFLVFFLLAWIAFVLSGILPLSNLLLLCFVLLLHEMGHYLGMCLLGYRNVRMFFIPFLGAAVSGRTLQAPAAAHLLIYLLGPLPGLLLGYLCGLAYLSLGLELARQLAVLLVVLNALNFLPVYPLDGGQFLAWLIVDRHPLLQLMVQLCGNLLILILGFAFFLPYMLYMGAFVGFVAGSTVSLFLHTFAVNRIAVRYRKQSRLLGETDAAIPLAVAQTLLSDIYDQLLVWTPKGAARLAIEIWARARARCPAWRDRLRLLGLYVLIWASVGIASAVYLFYQQLVR